MKTATAFDEIRKAWVRYVLLLGGLVVLVVAVVFGTWPMFFDSVVERVLLREYLPSPWPKPPAPAAVAGCYDLSFGEWVPKEDLGPDSCFVHTPLKVELTLGRHETRDGWFLMRAAAGEAGGIHRLTVWRITPERTVSLVWSTGFSGVTAELGPAGLNLQGQAKTFWDFPRSVQMASLTARPVTCEAAGKK